MRIIRKGILTTFQDYGRQMYLSQGINRGGVMDQLRFTVLNMLLGNTAGEAAMEIHFPGPEIGFTEACRFAITGAYFSPVLNDSPLGNDRVYQAKPGDVLRFKKKIRGERAYFGVSGKFLAKTWLGSKSKGLGMNALEETVVVEPSFTKLLPSLMGVSRAFDFSILPVVRIRFAEGKEWGRLSGHSKQAMTSQVFEISRQSDRMGYRLNGPVLEMSTSEQVLSSAVSFGTIQLPADGQPIILMADAQTTGGYPRVGFVIAADLPLLAQCGPGQYLSFEKVSLEEAEDLLYEQQAELRKLKAALELMNI